MEASLPIELRKDKDVYIASWANFEGQGATAEEALQKLGKKLDGFLIDFMKAIKEDLLEEMMGT